MPAVPKHNGCNACRKQKKKCDQAKPRCSRCNRLNVECATTSHPRFMFQEPFAIDKTGPKTQLALRQAAFHRWAPPSTPNNGLTSLANRFIAALQVTDPRFDLVYFGTWLADIPARLGASELLDTAASALVAAVEGLRVGRQSATALSSYGKALNCLIKALQDPVKAKEPYTLGAVFMVMVSQPCLSPRVDYVNHMEGVAHLLNFSAGKKWNGHFEETLRFHLVFPAYMAAAINPNIQIDLWYTEKYSTPYGPYKPLGKEDEESIESLSICTVMRYPTILRDPELHSKELHMHYERMLLEGPFLHRRLCHIYSLNKAIGTPNIELQRAEVKLRLAYAVLLFYTLIINAFLSALDPTDSSLSTAAILMAKDATKTAKIATRTPTIGPTFMPLCVFAAWFATNDADILADIKATMVESGDYLDEWHWMTRLREAKARIYELRVRRLALVQENSLDTLNVS